VVRLQWFDAANDSAGSVSWRLPAIILATLFLNFFFWFEPAHQFSFSGSPASYFVSLVGLCALVPALFFLGPALSAYGSQRSLFEVAEVSFGTVLGAAVRLGCAALALLWTASVVGSITSRFLRFNFDFSAFKCVIAAGALAVYVFVTGVQSLQTSARLACFTNKLGIAMLIAAAIRVRAYFPYIWSDLHHSGAPTDTFWSHVADPLMIAGPLSFLASAFGHRSRGKGDVARIGIFGLGLPMAGTLFAVSAIQSAAYHWRSDLGSLANINLALWGADSLHFLPQWMMIALITLFGLARFCAKMLDAALVPIIQNRNLRFAALSVPLLITTAMNASDSPIVSNWPAPAARITAMIAAIITADLLVRRPHDPIARKLDWLALVSLLSGWAAVDRLDSWAGDDYSSRLGASILTAYGTSFIVFLLGRIVQRGMKLAVFA